MMKTLTLFLILFCIGVSASPEDDLAAAIKRDEEALAYYKIRPYGALRGMNATGTHQQIRERAAESITYSDATDQKAVCVQNEIGLICRFLKP